MKQSIITVIDGDEIITENCYFCIQNSTNTILISKKIGNNEYKSINIPICEKHMITLNNIFTDKSKFETFCIKPLKPKITRIL